MKEKDSSKSQLIEKLALLRQKIIDLELQISEYKQVNEELQNNEKRYRILVENSYDIVYSVNIAGIITYIGPQISHFGYTPEKLISKKTFWNLSFLGKDSLLRIVL